MPLRFDLSGVDVNYVDKRACTICEKKFGNSWPQPLTKRRKVSELVHPSIREETETRERASEERQASQMPSEDEEQEEKEEQEVEEMEWDDI